MEGAELIADGLGRVNQLLHRSLTGVSAETLCQMPTPETNSMAWLAWHLTRVQDHHISDLAGLPQLWTSEGWHAKFGMDANDKETGTGHTLEQVAALKVDGPDLLLAYNDAVYERSKAYLAGVKPGDLDQEINEPQYNPLPIVGVRLVSIVSDNTQHAGQIGYLRGYFEGLGWSKA
ncbi:MAG: DinB family protein [Dehalococcoidia bacterium]